MIQTIKMNNSLFLAYLLFAIKTLSVGHDLPEKASFTFLRSHPLCYFAYLPTSFVMKAHPDTSNPTDLKKPTRNENQIRELLIIASENYLLILPRILGCGACQYAHTAFSSALYQHYLHRKNEVEEFQKILNQSPFVPEEAARFLREEMGPFKGEYAKLFYAQCMLALEGTASCHNICVEIP